MRSTRLLSSISLSLTIVAIGCSSSKTPSKPVETSPAITYFKVDPTTAGSITGKISYSGKSAARKPIDMSEDPACVEAHHGKAYDESLVTGSGLANAFIYIKSGLEGKNFPVPSEPVIINQGGCQFHPHVLGVQVGQPFQVTNSDPVTHNIHPMAEVNREWNHSQGPGDPALNRKFLKPEIMIPVKCNIHGWMHAYIGVLDHPYFSVSKEDGTFHISDLPPGNYTLATWHEKLGEQTQQITVPPSGHVTVNFTYKGK